MPPARDAALFAPIFVLATARSYSSVASTMLGQHPQLFGFPEMKLFAWPTVGALEASLSSAARTPDFAHRSPGLVRAVAQVVFGEQSLSALGQARRWLDARADWSGADVFDVLMHCVWPRVAVEKSPEHALDPMALDRLVQAYPRARYVHLTRHPVTAATSMQRHMQATDEDGLTFCFYSWYAANFRVMERLAALPGWRYLRVRAEDVLNDPGDSLPRVARWLGLATDAASIRAMRHPERSPFACFAAAGSGVRGGNDPAFLGDPVPRCVDCPACVEPPEGWNGPASLWSAVVELAEQLGYSPGASGSSAIPGRSTRPPGPASAR